MRKQNSQKIKTKHGGEKYGCKPREFGTKN